MATPHQILKQYWGYDTFRPLQEEIINAIAGGKDVLALLPTGGGKSICFQVPALMRDGICLVVSPLIALIKDQVYTLNKKGIPALAIYSGMHYNEVKQTLQNAAYGNFKFLYLSPERLETKLFLEFLPAIQPSLIVVDEAHCISQWGYDFRPPYQRIAQLREQLPSVNFAAVTASATPVVQQDICDKLAFASGYKIFQQSFARPSISYSAFSPQAKETKLLEVLKNVPGSALVYCSSRKKTQEIASLLKLHGLDANYYHAGLPASERSERQETWLNSKKAIMVCTNAFGMGIDKPNVRVVIHADVPESLENYYQEAGRAGRDGNRAYAVLLYSQKELEGMDKLVDMRYPTFVYLKQLYMDVMNYLQVAAGGGEGESYDFDLPVFCNNFKHGMLQATYGLQALAQEGLISYNESFFKASVIEVMMNRQDIESFGEQEPALFEMLQALLRNYQGIIDHSCTIYETLLAKFCKMPVADVKAKLIRLHELGVIHYTPAADKQQIFLIQSRMYADSFKLDLELLHKRKLFYAERLATIKHFTAGNTICRNKQIARYFGEAEGTDCGICDNCMLRKKNEKLEATRKELLDALVDWVASGNTSTGEMLIAFKKFKKEDVWNCLSYLLGEEIILQDSGGKLQPGKVKA